MATTGLVANMMTILDLALLVSLGVNLVAGGLLWWVWSSRHRELPTSSGLVATDEWMDETAHTPTMPVDESRKGDVEEAVVKLPTTMEPWR